MIGTMGNHILLDLVSSEEQAKDLPVSGWNVRFSTCLVTLLRLLDQGYIEQVDSHNRSWTIRPTAKGVAYAKTLKATVQESAWKGTIAKLNR